MKKLFLLPAALIISFSVFAQSNPNLKDRVEQRPDTRSNGDARQSISNDRNKSDDASKTTNSKGVGNAGIAMCAGEFALCASSTCKPTGKTITVKEDGGKTTKQYGRFLPFTWYWQDLVLFLHYRNDLPSRASQWQLYSATSI